VSVPLVAGTREFSPGRGRHHYVPPRHQMPPSHSPLPSQLQAPSPTPGTGMRREPLPSRPLPRPLAPSLLPLLLLLLVPCAPSGDAAPVACPASMTCDSPVTGFFSDHARGHLQGGLHGPGARAARVLQPPLPQHQGVRLPGCTTRCAPTVRPLRPPPSPCLARV